MVTLFSYRWDVSQLLQITMSSPSLVLCLNIKIETTKHLLRREELIARRSVSENERNKNSIRCTKSKIDFHLQGRKVAAAGRFWISVTKWTFTVYGQNFAKKCQSFFTYFFYILSNFLFLDTTNLFWPNLTCHVTPA